MDNITHKAIAYRIYPTTKQKGKLEWTFRRCCELYNAALQERIGAYKKFGTTLSNFTQQKSLKDIKLQDCRPEYKDIDSQVLKSVIVKLDEAYKGFFARVKKGEAGNKGFPKFLKSRYYSSICYPTSNSNGIQGVKFLDNQKIRLNAVGEVRIKLHKPLEGKLCTLTIKKDVDKWFAIFVVKIEKPEHLPTTGLVCGIDLGLKDFVTIYDGTETEVVEPLKAYREAEKKLRIAQRKVARRQGGKGVKSSNRREKAKNILAKHHQTIRNQRKDFIYQNVSKLVNKYDVICIENLNVAAMSQGLKLGKSVNDSGMGMFKVWLKHKAEEAGKIVVEVDRWYPSSKLCAECGYKNKELKLSDRTWTCPSCNTVLQRDENAARNIRAEGLAQYQGIERAFSRKRKSLDYALTEKPCDLVSSQVGLDLGTMDTPLDVS